MRELTEGQRADRRTDAGGRGPENPAKAQCCFLGFQELVSFSAFVGGIGIPTIELAGLGLFPWRLQPWPRLYCKRRLGG